MNTETFLTILEKEQFSEKAADEIKAWMKLLLPIEQEVIKILYVSQYPLSAKGIVDNIVDNLWESARRQNIQMGGRRVLWDDTSFPGKVETVVPVLKKIVTDIDFTKTQAEILNQKRDKLIQSGLVQIPDPRRIERILNDLQSLCIIVARDLTDKKAKKVYALNPRAYNIFKEMFAKT